MVMAMGGCVWLRRRGERYVSTGLLLAGIAAFIGVLRDGINPGLDELHRFVWNLAACTGLPLIAVQYCTTGFGVPDRDGRMVVMGASVVGFAAFGLAFPLVVYPWVVALGGSAVLLASAVAMRRTWPSQALAAALGAIGVVAAGLVKELDIGGPGLSGIELHHLLLALAWVGLTVGLPLRSADW